ncbi:PAS domain S-box protein [candidate division KSB1 bacterium]|nr:PAS domain S-box protein [candidate division KSB1 bacterium]RQW11805.1 MAG: PAS domain S-box protein [candidate division KSB1 bacterium]
MNLSFEKPSLIKGRFALHPRIVLSLTLVLALILIASAVLDYWGTKRELSHVLEEQAKALITALEKGSQNAIASYDLVQDLVAERLLDNARFLEELDYNGQLDERYLQKRAEQNRLFRIHVYGANGELRMASFRGFGRGPGPSSDLMQAMQKNDVDELVLGFLSGRFGQSRRFAVAKKRRLGGVIVINVDSNEMLDFRRAIGLGRLIRDIGENDGVAYIALQDTASIITATEGLDSLSTIQTDPLLAQILQDSTIGSRFTDFQGRQIFELIHPFDRDNGELLRIGLNTTHLREAQRSARTRAILSSLLLLIFGVIGAGWAANRQNVRSLQNAYDRIETYTGSMLENMSDGIVAINGNGDITLVNRAAEELFGMPASALLGKPCNSVLPPLCPYFQDGLTSAQDRTYPEEKLATPAGLLTVFLSVNVIRNDKDAADIVFALIRNMTEIKRLEENLRRKDQITAMGQLASGVAHEIRNPLNAIGMIAQRLKSEFPMPDQDYAQLTTTIVNETRRINGIIQQFLQFARPAELVTSRLTIAQPVAEMVTLLQPQAEKKGVRIVNDCQADIQIYADADKLKQVLLNLGQNAIDACSQGDVITIACEAKDNALVLRVQDTGAGIPLQERDKIFNLYFTSKENGTGIGLSLVQQIISQHNGTIEVQSEENVGSTFTITLPILPARLNFNANQEK